MSAFCLKLVTTFCLCCTALSGPGHRGVVRKEAGGSVTIQCRSETGRYSLSLSKDPGNKQILVVDDRSKKMTPAGEVETRYQVNGTFPNYDILINNLTFDDTGLYWCTYYSSLERRNTTSMLLVVEATTLRCEQRNDNLILVSLLICAAVLLVLIACFLIWIISKTRMCTTKKPRHVPGNDVYEDMRATIRR
ncbi:immunoglobulin V-set domain-containing protein [Pungitius pungitius]|uniref:immunoglobulin V-set domain-containing protein n=1 Tax=Pungitius pungitius TaxID=134920 RepID=UPI002E0F72A4